MKDLQKELINQNCPIVEVTDQVLFENFIIL
jgi:hypothetical protein